MEKAVTDHLFVWIYLPHQATPVPCGRLDLIGGRQSLFSYAAEYLERADSFPVSPDLPLRPGQYAPPPGFPLPPIFEDAGPDRWGQRVIDRAFNPRRRAAIDYLALAGEDRIGALGFCLSDQTYIVEPSPAFHRGDLASLLEAARAVELQLPIDERLRQLLRPGGTAGGARPKATIDDDGRAWIAKFPAQGDDVDFCAIEHACLRLSAACGIDVPESRLVRLERSSILLVARFDREPDGTRIHFASARTMLLAQGIAEQDMSYADIAEVARQLSPTPVDDSRQMFRRMVFNVLIENTDDHAKNHAFLHAGRQSWRLAPAYDLQPQMQGLHYHQLIIGNDGSEPSLANALSYASRFMLTESEARTEIEALLDGVSKWKEVFSEAGVPPYDIEACAPCMMRDTTLPSPRTRRRSSTK